MNSDRVGDILGIVGALVLVVSALVVRQRRLPRGRSVRMALLWAVIFLAAFAVAHMLDGRRILAGV